MLLLEGTVVDYEYLNTSRASINGVNDSHEWWLLKTVFDVVGLSPTKQMDLFRIIAAILHIGNIQITADWTDQGHINALCTSREGMPPPRNIHAGLYQSFVMT